MPADNNARQLTVNFNGGSITATRRLLELMFGDDLVVPDIGGSTTVSVNGHTRRRVIGGPTTSVSGHDYQRRQYPTSAPNGAKGGEPIAVLYDGDWWTARLTGSHQDFDRFLEAATWSTGWVAYWKSEKGKSHGPFNGGVVELP